MIWLLLRRFWPYLAGAGLLAIIGWQIHAYGGRRYDEGKALVQAKWNAALVAANEVERAREQRARDHNASVIEQYSADLVAIAADRDSLAGRLREYEASLGALRMRQATDRLGLAVGTQIASRAAEVDRLYDQLDTACRLDAAQLEALIGQIRPQL